ncbi:hypothetical protein [Phytohabitans houttuyneae]|uniref:Uncharacterized protein n=1 Tax=Phytohabitans houttuyneae TaxID=1076126 RepID=A0A6V8KIJ3_9ACTN|nr:hypothetical protein [Phytohabitans houttuyneae]GFJ85022.1 hypothetical protein Phou_092020 [Phytohabitans houttuyneae]
MNVEIFGLIASIAVALTGFVALLIARRQARHARDQAEAARRLTAIEEERLMREREAPRWGSTLQGDDRKAPNDARNQQHDHSSVSHPQLSATYQSAPKRGFMVFNKDHRTFEQLMLEIDWNRTIPRTIAGFLDWYWASYQIKVDRIEPMSYAFVPIVKDPGTPLGIVYLNCAFNDSSGQRWTVHLEVEVTE